MKKLTIFDCDGVCWAVFHAMGGTLSHEGMGTSIIHGFLNHIFASQSFDKADVLVFAWDSGESIREKMFPEYKLKRRLDKDNYTEEEKELHTQRVNQFKLLKYEILEKLGFSNIFFQKGYEGDDVIAKVVQQYKSNYQIKIVARDQDLYQLIDKTVTMYDPVKGKLFTRKLIKDTYGIEPHQFKDVKALYGCTTDEVPGLKGIGETTALKYVRGELGFTTKAYKTIQNGSSVIDFTRSLTTLPLAGINDFTIQNDTCLINKIKMVARKYGLKSFVTEGRLNEYCTNFCDRVWQEATQDNRRMGTNRPHLSDF